MLVTCPLFTSFSIRKALLLHKSFSANGMPLLAKFSIRKHLLTRYEPFSGNYMPNYVLDKISRSWLAVPMAISEAIPQNPGNFRFEARLKFKYFCDWSIEKGQNFEPIKIQNLSKSGWKFLVLGQVCCSFSRCKMAEIQRFYRANSEYIESLINASENKNTKDSTRNWLKQFESGQLKEKRKLTWKNMLQRNWTVHFVSFLQNLERLMVMTMSWMFSAIDIWNPRITPNQSGKTIFFSLAAKFWKKRPESYVLKVKQKDLTVLNVWTLRKKKFYGNVYSLGLSHQNP